VVASRSGDVLIKNTLLKADHFPGCQNLKLTPLLEGAPNFRQVRFFFGASRASRRRRRRRGARPTTTREKVSRLLLLPSSSSP
jgi:hypothetical protein